MSAAQLSLKSARKIQLSAQGLLHKPRRRARPDDILKIINQMSVLQIDTINVVARSPYLVLFSRLGDYPMNWLEESLSRGEIIEYWAHEACFLPRTDYELIRHRMLNPHLMGWKYNASWMEAHSEEINTLLSTIREQGPVRAADFSQPKSSASGWWDWKPYKRHLEGLFTAGELMVVGRHNFQRLYDVAQRVMPDWSDDLHLLTPEQSEEKMLLNSAASLGIFREGWLADYYRLKKVELKNRLRRWQELEIIRAVEVESLGEMWVHHAQFPQLEQAIAGKLNATHTTVLSPFDPVVWDRRRASELFEFDYRLECYTPAPRRQYGYFVLPLLYRGALVGRMDARMLRKQQTLEIVALYLEPGQPMSLTIGRELAAAITSFGRWQGAQQVRLLKGPDELIQLWGRGWEIR